MSIQSIFDSASNFLGVGHALVKFQIPRNDPISKNPTFIDLIEMEATVKETHTYTSEITENPLEDGTFASDHANIKPRELTMECFISNSPLSIKQAVIGNAAGLVGGIIGRASGNNILSAVATGGLASLATKLLGMKGGTRVAQAIQKLQAAWEGSSPISVMNALTNYTNMVITNMTFNRSKETAGLLSFTITLKEIRVVTSRDVITPASILKNFAKPSGTSQTDNGNQPLKTPTAPQSSLYDTLSKGGSFAKGLFNP